MIDQLFFSPRTTRLRESVLVSMKIRLRKV